MSRARITLSALAACLLAGLLVPAAPAVADPNDYTATTTTITTSDGVDLYAEVFRPAELAPDERTPVILLASPYLDASLSGEREPAPVSPHFARTGIWERGYTLVQVSLRGFGLSEGCNDFGGRGEQTDVHSAVEWAARQPWSTGKVGMWGMSYDAYTQVMALATKPDGLAAAFIVAPLISGYRGLFMNGVHYGSGWHMTPATYQSSDVQGRPADTPANAGCHLTNLKEQADPDPTTAYWRERDLVAAARGSDVPVFWTHGYLDANTKPDNFLDLWSTLTGPKHAWFGQWAHTTPAGANSIGRDALLDEVIRFMDRHVRGVPESVTRTEEIPAVTVQDGAGWWWEEPQWPPADATPYEVPVLDGVYRDAPGNSANGGSAQTGVGTWTFTPPLPHAAHLSGVTSVSVEVTKLPPAVNLVALLYDVAPDGQAALVTRGATKVTGGRATLDLYPQDWPLKEGSRLGLLLTGADGNWFDPGTTLTDVEVTSGTWAPPLLRYQRDRPLEGGVSTPIRNRAYISIDADTIESRTVDVEPPPPMVPRGG